VSESQSADDDNDDDRIHAFLFLPLDIDYHFEAFSYSSYRRFSETMNSSDDSSVEYSVPDDEEMIRQSLQKTTLNIDWGEDNDGIFASVDSFLELSKGNNIVQTVYLDQYWGDYSERGLPTMEAWEQLGKGIGNLQALKELKIRFSVLDLVEVDVYHDEEEPPDFEALARVLHHVRQKITLSVDMFPTRLVAEGFARAIREHPTIQTFKTSEMVDDQAMGLLLPALATLPALESIDLQAEFVHAFEHPEHLTTLLMSRSLRSVALRDFDLTIAAWQAVAHALKSGSPITRLSLNNCSFPNGGAGSIVHALHRNSTLETLILDFETTNGFDELFCDALASLLLVNTTLTDLTVHIPPLDMPPLDQFRRTWLHPFLVALRINTSLKKLHLNNFSMSDESVCGALGDVFVKNTVLEELTLRRFCGPLMGDTDVVAWRNTLPFLRDNKTLKSLVVTVDGDHVANFCLDTVTMLKDNCSLECLDINSSGVGTHVLRLDDYLAALERLQPNMTLKTLLLHPTPIRSFPNLPNFGRSFQHKTVMDGKIKHFVSLVKKNYALESLDPYLYGHDKTGELCTILRLNRAGRRYLIEDAGSIAKGVEVLSTVSEDLNCLLYHLLENPLLCDIEHQGKNDVSIADGNVHSNKRQRTSK
jgi:hypothetical protein